jgi:hypothetical protein
MAYSLRPCCTAIPHLYGDPNLRFRFLHQPTKFCPDHVMLFAGKAVTVSPSFGSKSSATAPSFMVGLSLLLASGGAALTAVLLSALCCCLHWRKRAGAIQLDDTPGDESAAALTDPTGRFPIPPPLDPQMVPDDLHISSGSFPSVTSRIVSTFEDPEQP